ncbi:MAG: T9SS type A sorting domain-containing protein [Calditrichaeota bacterium]|nr:T9SS type A sorting domain-containing protein [Calditrichota bacterium]
MKQALLLLSVSFFIVVLIAVPGHAQFELLWGRGNPMGMGNIHGVTVDPETGHLYITHFADQSIHHFDEDLEHVETFNIGLGGIRGLGFDTQENQLIVANGGNIRILNLNGELLRTFANNGGSNTVDHDPERDLYVVGRFGGAVAYFNRDGEQVGGFDSGVNITGICYYPINGTIFAMDTDDPVSEFTIEGERIGEPLQGDQIVENGQDLAYDSRQRILYATGQVAWLGAFEDNYGAVGEPEVNPEGFDLQVPFGMAGEEVLVITNVGEEGSSLSFEIEDVGEGVDWLECDPTEGELELDESAEITLTIATEDLQPGNVQRTIIVHTNSPDFREVEIPVALMVIAGFGELSGTVTDAANDNPIEGATITVENFNLEAVSDENGRYVIPEIPEWIFTVSITAEDYLPQTMLEIEIIEDEVTNLDFDMLHSIGDLSLEQISEEIPVDEEVEIPVNLANPGNGPLTWSVERVFPEGMEADPWDSREVYAAGDILENNRLGGVEFVDGNFYVAGGLSDGENQIYVLNRDGELVRQFNQFQDSRYGFRDLTYDGNLLWGIDDNIVHGFTTRGELDVTFDAPVRSARGITWDRENELLWICGITSDIFGVNRNGEIVREIERPGDVRMYGLAWYPDDADGYNLYMFCSNGEFNRQIFKFDLENEQVVFVAEPDLEGSAGAATITRAWDPFSWVFLTITNSPDYIEILHIEAPTGWVGIEPIDGVLDAGEDMDMAVNLNTFGFPVNIEFTVDLVFTHDGVGGETILPVLLTASGDEGPEVRTLRMDFGWNMVSVNVVPESDDVVAITQTLVDGELMEMMKNGSGQFYSPAFGFNNIPGWEVTDGYLIKTTEDCELEIEGMPVAADEAIPLTAGWQMKGYFPRVSVEATVALSGIVENLEMAKDGSGRFYSPAFGFSNMGDLMEGFGYMLKMSEAMDLVYVVEENRLAQSRIVPGFLPILKPTAENMSLLVLQDVSAEFIEIGVYANNILVGSGHASGESCGIAVWGDDPTTTSRDGSLKGDNLELRFTNETGRNVSFDFVTISGNEFYQHDELWVVELNNLISIPDEFGIVSAYPNPFNSTTQISFRLTESGKIDLALFDLSGRQVLDLITGQYKAGLHTVTLDGSSLSSGFYLAKLNSTEGSSKLKLSFIK